MPTSLFVYQPGDVIYVQVDAKTPVRSYLVENNGVLREVTYDQLGMVPSVPRGSSPSPTGNSDKTRMFNRGQA